MTTTFKKTGSDETSTNGTKSQRGGYDVLADGEKVGTIAGSYGGAARNLIINGKYVCSGNLRQMKMQAMDIISLRTSRGAK